MVKQVPGLERELEPRLRPPREIGGGMVGFHVETGLLSIPEYRGPVETYS